MGLFDLPAPLIAFIDGFLVFLPPAVRIALWGLVSGVLSMLLYAALSPQSKLSTVKAELQDARALLATADDSFDDLLQLVRRTLRLSFKHLGLVLLPAILASLPIISLLAWASNEFGYQFPAPGSSVALQVQPQSAADKLGLQPAGEKLLRVNDGTLELPWPDDGTVVTLHDSSGNMLLSLPSAAPVPSVHKRLWWNNLLGNPIGYLPENTDIDALFLEFPERRYLSLGPGWLGHWLTLFFGALVVSALLTKVILKID